MDKNEPLDYRDAMMRIIRRRPKLPLTKVVKAKRLKIFTELHGLSGKAYQDKLKELKHDID